MSGHIRRRGERSWELKFDLGIDPVTGKRRDPLCVGQGHQERRTGETNGAAQRGRARCLVDPSKETLAAFMDRWDRDWATHNVSLKTGERYRQLITNQIKPHLGAMPVQKIKPVHLNSLYCHVAAVWRHRGRAIGAADSRTLLTDCCAGPSDTRHSGASSPRTRLRWCIRRAWRKPKSRSSAKMKSRSCLMRCAVVT